jgi:asparagine synthase (glutamine-hydrolysing)
MCYWSAKESALRGAAEPFQGSAKDAVAQLDQLLMDSVRLRMLADVPLGAFLSGGIDSSAVVSMMQANAATPVKTFSIGFKWTVTTKQPTLNELPEQFRDSTPQLYVTTEGHSGDSKVPYIYDEPFADSSQIPTFLISQLAREQSYQPFRRWR